MNRRRPRKSPPRSFWADVADILATPVTRHPCRPVRLIGRVAA